MNKIKEQSGSADLSEKQAGRKENISDIRGSADLENYENERPKIHKKERSLSQGGCFITCILLSLGNRQDLM